MELTDILSEASTTLVYAQLIVAIFALGLGALVCILSVPLKKRCLCHHWSFVPGYRRRSGSYNGFQ